MARIVIQLSTEKGFTDKVIRWVTWSDFSHVDLVLSDGSLLGARLDGVKIRPNGYAQFTSVQRWAVECSPEQARMIIEAATEQLGKPYDLRGILNMVLQRDWREQDCWFCSELVAWAFEQGGIPLLNRCVSVRRIVPQHVLLSSRLAWVTPNTVSLME